LGRLLYSFNKISEILSLRNIKQIEINLVSNPLRQHFEENVGLSSQLYVYLFYLKQLPIINCISFWHAEILKKNIYKDKIQ